MCCCIYLDVQVEYLSLVGMINLHMERRRVLQNQIVNFKPGTVDQIEHMRSVILIVHQFLIIQKDQHPPMIPSAINFATSTYLKILAIVELKKIPMTMTFVARPVSDTLRCCKFA